MRLCLPTVALTASAALLPLAACTSTTDDITTARAAVVAEAPVDPGLPTAVMHKSATCACCVGHEAHLREHGYRVEHVLYEDAGELEALEALKDSLGVPAQHRSCHTTVIGGYVVEGHVPVEEIALLLADRPDIDGISLPGMPAGSPGMTGSKHGTWDYISFVDGEPSLYASR